MFLLYYFMKKYSRKKQGTFVHSPPWFLISSDLTKKTAASKFSSAFLKFTIQLGNKN